MTGGKRHFRYPSMTDHCETISITKYPMVGKTVITLSFSTYELGFYHFRMPVTLARTIEGKRRQQERARNNVKAYEEYIKS